MLQHETIDIYWYGFRVGQQLIDYPIQEYYFLEDISNLVTRTDSLLGNLGTSIYAHIDQSALNATQQHLRLWGVGGGVQTVAWDIGSGLSSVLDTRDLKGMLLKYQLI